MKTFAAVCIAATALAAAAFAAPPVTLTLNANPSVVAYGKPVTLSGQVSTKKANQQVVIQGTACGATSATKAATVRTTANGAYTASVTPALGTTYRGNFKNGTSQPVVVGVKPLLELKRVARASDADRGESFAIAQGECSYGGQSHAAAEDSGPESGGRTDRWQGNGRRFGA